MRNVALMLGIVGGVAAFWVGGFLAQNSGNIGLFSEQAGQEGEAVLSPFRWAAQYVAPVMAILGGVLSLRRAYLGAAVMAVAVLLLLLGYGYTAFTMAPLVFIGAGAVLAALVPHLRATEDDA
jgi:hypothetical protein